MSSTSSAKFTALFDHSFMLLKTC